MGKRRALSIAGAVALAPQFASAADLAPARHYFGIADLLLIDAKAPGANTKLNDTLRLALEEMVECGQVPWFCRRIPCSLNLIP